MAFEMTQVGNFNSPSFNYKGVRAHYSTLTYAAQAVPLYTTKLFDNVEFGELIGFKFHTDESDMALMVTLYGEGDSKYIVNDKTPEQIISLGFGMAPGDPVTVGGISPDRAGIPNPVYPWVARYKTTTDVDITDEDGAHYVTAYTPDRPIPYKRINMHISNAGTTNATLYELQIDRIIYESMDGR